MKRFREVFSPIEENTFVISGADTSCIVIDCGCYGRREENRLEELLNSLKLNPILLLNTHCHLDHVFGNGFMLRRYGLSARSHPGEDYNLRSAPEHAMMFGLKMETPPEPGTYLTDGEIIEAAGLTLEVVAVPGHSPGGVAFFCRNEGILFTGDALFAGSIGRSDLPGGNHESLIKNITGRLFTLPGETVVYPGHGPETTIKQEIETNPYFQ